MGKITKKLDKKIDKLTMQWKLKFPDDVVVYDSKHRKLELENNKVKLFKNQVKYNQLNTYSRYTTSLTCAPTELQLSGRTQLLYGITLDKSGNVIDYVATDGTYYYDFNGTSTAPLKVEQIDNGQGSVIRLADAGNTSAVIACATDSSKGVFEITPQQ